MNDIKTDKRIEERQLIKFITKSQLKDKNNNHNNIKTNEIKPEKCWTKNIKSNFDSEI